MRVLATDQGRRFVFLCKPRHEAGGPINFCGSRNRPRGSISIVDIKRGWLSSGPASLFKVFSLTILEGVL